MQLLRAKKSHREISYWPGFVDAMSSILLVIIFLLSFFALSQFFLSQELNSRDSVLNQLNAQVRQLTDLLSLEQNKSDNMIEQINSLNATIADLRQENSQAVTTIATLRQELKTSGDDGTLDEQKRLSDKALSQVKILNQQISSLRQQILVLESTLDIAEQKNIASEAKIKDLGKRLNVALAKRVQELSRYRSEFFGRLRQIVSQRSDIKVVGDRFVFQASVLFAAGDDQLSEDGERAMDNLATAINDLKDKIPTTLNWVVRIDGHTDVRPINTERFASNWELSADRAISVVKYLISRGVPAERLAATGFGEFQPIAAGDSESDYARNRRIEVKLTER